MRDCLGLPVLTPLSDPPLSVLSRSRLHWLAGTEADLRMVTVLAVLELRDSPAWCDWW